MIDEAKNIAVRTILNWKQAPAVIYRVAAVFVSDLALVIALFSM